MEGNSPYITNLVNSIIGVSVLAMPFCLKQCGIILGLVLLFGAAWLTYVSCSMLVTSAFHKRRRTYEYLAFYTLGPTGKFTVELSMIGMMLGTCVAFYVVIGDLSNGILSKFIDGADPHMLRTFTIVFCALCIALPLGMMKDLSVLSYFGYFSLLFYLSFVVVVILNAISNGFLQWDWFDEVNLWRPAGVFQCLPIFSLAYACQCQLFIVYDSLEEPSVRRIEDIVSSAIKFVTVVYMSVGFFGYTTYHNHISGNLLVSFPSNMLLDFIKLGFAASVLLGFPLIIFPCRQSIHTLFFGKPAGEGLQPNTYIPPFLFKSITLAIVLSTMTIAIVIPNVETILGLTGATMGSIICFIFPALIYDKVSPKGPAGFPKFVFAVGCLLLVVCTYSNLANTGQTEVVEHPVVPVDLQIPPVDLHNIGKDEIKIDDKDTAEQADDKKPDIIEDKDKQKPQVVAEVHDDEHRHEPANPIDPDNLANQEKSPDETEKFEDSEKPVEKKDEVESDVANDLINKDSAKIDANIQPPSEAKQSPDEQNKPPILEKDVVPVPVGKDDSPSKQVESPVHKDTAKKEVMKPQDNSDQLKNPNIGGQDDAQKPAQEAESVIKKEPIKQEEVRQERELQQPSKQEQAGVKHEKADVHQEKDDVKHEPVIHLEQGKQEGAVQGEMDKQLDKAEAVQQKDAPPEKELLEKIKQQHDKQQQLLIEQEELIKKLEEHQDKKEQIEEENQFDSLNNNHPVEPDQPMNNKGAQPDPDNVQKPAVGLMGEVLDPKIDIPGQKEVLQNQIVVDKILPGRELLEKKIYGEALVPHNKTPDDAMPQEIKKRNKPISEGDKSQRVQRDLNENEQVREFLELDSQIEDLNIEKIMDIDDKIKNGDNASVEIIPSPKEPESLEEEIANKEESKPDPELNPLVNKLIKDDNIQAEAEKSYEDCLADDVECWQAKSKTRELKSLDLNDL